MNDYQFWLSIGLCPRCHKRKVAPGHRACHECLDKANAYNRARNQSYYSALPAERKDEIRGNQRTRYAKHKANGICVCCTRKATHGIFCDEHWRKHREYTRQERSRGGVHHKQRRQVPIPEQKKQTKVDVGKIIALYNAGWSYKEIITEMRISESDISYWIRKAKEAADDIQRSA